MDAKKSATLSSNPARYLHRRRKTTIGAIVIARDPSLAASVRQRFVPHFTHPPSASAGKRLSSSAPSEHDVLRQRPRRRPRGVPREPKGDRAQARRCRARGDPRARRARRRRGQGQDHVRQDRAGPRGGPAGGRHDAPVHRPPHGARGDLSPGVRGPPHRRPRRAPPRLHARDRGPQRAHLRPLRVRHRGKLHQGDGFAPAGDGAGGERRGLRPHLLRNGRQASGRGAHHRTRAGLHAARHHRGVRRLAHRHARRVRCARLRHRHVRGGARARHADAAPEAV